MKLLVRTLFLLPVICLAFPEPVTAAVVFGPGKKAKAEAPGDETISGNAQELFSKAQEAERKGNLKRAIKAYQTVARRHPKDTLAAGSIFRMGQLHEERRSYINAAECYGRVADRYAKSEHFDQAIEGLFRIGEKYLAGRKVKLLGIPFKASMDQAVDIFTAIVRVAPYGKYAARAQFSIGRARERQGANELAIAAYQAVVEKFPNDPLAADAQYQIGYIWAAATKSGTYDPAAPANAKTGFQDFLYRHPNSEKAAQARENLKTLDRKQTSTAFQIAKYYDKQRHYRAAGIYYNEVIRQQPGSEEGQRAKKRIAELRAKVGDKVLQPPAVTAAAANRKSKRVPTAEDGSSSSANDSAPLPPADVDTSLPPPASLLPDTTTAPPSSTGDADTTPTPSATPETSALP